MYKRLLLSGTRLSEDVINKICNYIYGLEHFERFKPTLDIIDGIKYYNDFEDNSSKINIEENVNRTTTYMIKMCPGCNRFYRTNMIRYRNGYKGYFRYSHYNSFLFDSEDSITTEYVVSYNMNILNWRNTYTSRRYNKNISCNCYNQLALNVINI